MGWMFNPGRKAVADYCGYNTPAGHEFSDGRIDPPEVLVSLNPSTPVDKNKDRSVIGALGGIDIQFVFHWVSVAALVIIDVSSFYHLERFERVWFHIFFRRWKGGSE
jgi:hypothetical protein